MKHKRNVSFLETKEFVRTYMGEESYASIAQRADTTNQDNKYRTFVEKLIQLEVNDWSMFQEQLKKLHSAASDQKRVGNGERSNVIVQTKTHVWSTTPKRTTPKSAKSPTKQPLHKSPIRPPKSFCSRRYFGLARNLIRCIISPNQDDLSYSIRTSFPGSRNWVNCQTQSRWLNNAVSADVPLAVLE